MADVSKDEVVELAVYSGIMHQCSYGISGQIQGQSKARYGIPQSVNTSGMDFAHADDEDLLRWAAMCVRDAGPTDHNGVIIWCSPIGRTSLYGTLVPELCRRLKYLSRTEMHERRVANVPFRAVRS